MMGKEVLVCLFPDLISLDQPEYLVKTYEKKGCQQDQWHTGYMNADVDLSVY